MVTSQSDTGNTPRRQARTCPGSVRSRIPTSRRAGRRRRRREGAHRGPGSQAVPHRVLPRTSQPRLHRRYAATRTRHRHGPRGVSRGARGAAPGVVGFIVQGEDRRLRPLDSPFPGLGAVEVQGDGAALAQAAAVVAEFHPQLVLAGRNRLRRGRCRTRNTALSRTADSSSSLREKEPLSRVTIVVSTDDFARPCVSPTTIGGGSDAGCAADPSIGVQR